MDAVVHLAGKNIAAGRWTQKLKEEIRQSRVQGTGLLCAALARLEQAPRVLISASAIGIYGSRGEEELTEDSPPGTGFLAEVGKAWEGATAPAQERGLRVVLARFGIALSAQGGALAKMLLPFKLGLGGRVGSGQQYFSWVALEDLVEAVGLILQKEELSGPVNVVAPNPVTNAELTRALGKVLGRPVICPLPAFAARLVLGELADEGLLASTRVVPARLRDSGFRFQHPELEGALRRLLEN
jgi:uncharacterized protein (TIGR01777 family)